MIEILSHLKVSCICIHVTITSFDDSLSHPQGIPNSVEVNEKGLFMFVSCLYGVCQMGLIPVTFNFGGELIYPEAEECSLNSGNRILR